MSARPRRGRPDLRGLHARPSRSGSRRRFRSRSPTSRWAPSPCGARAAEAAALIDLARARGVDVTADCYPYEAWHTNMEVLVPNKKYDDPASVETALAEVGGPRQDHDHGCKAHPEYAGRNMEEIARSRGHHAGRALHPHGQGGRRRDHRPLHDGRGRPRLLPAAVGHGRAATAASMSAHPRGAGTFPKVLGRYVRELHWLTLPEAIRKMTSLPAQRLKLARPRRDPRRYEGRPGAVRSEDRRSTARRSRNRRSSPSAFKWCWSTGRSSGPRARTPGARPGRVLTGGGAPPVAAYRLRGIC